MIIAWSICWFAAPITAQDLPDRTTMRFDEDYSGLRDPAARPDSWWESRGFTPLDDHHPTHAYATAGLEARARYEFLQDDGFGEGPQDDGGYFQTRLLPHLSVHLPLDDPAQYVDRNPPEIRGFVQLIVAHELGHDQRPDPIDENRGDLLQGFFEFSTPLDLSPTDKGRLAFQAGRRALSFGSERLVGTRYGVNVPRSFDGFFGNFQSSSTTFDLFWARPVVNDPNPWDDASSDQQSLWGIYSTWDLGAFATEAGIDLYYLGFLDDSSTFAQNFGGNPAREIRHTFGSRFYGRTPFATDQTTNTVLDWNLEAFLQTGRFDGASIQAWSLATDMGITFDTAGQPRIGLKANIISGDDDPDDPDLQTFNPLFPRGTYFGELSPVGPYNLINAQASLAVKPTSEWTATLQGGPFFRESTDDGVYGIPGNVIRPPSDLSDSRSIGWQWELLLEGSLSQNTDLLISYGQFHPGNFIEQTGAAEVIHLGAIELRLRF
ncbi:MAG: alginate export family protein [Planctomycetota bacterium]